MRDFKEKRISPSLDFMRAMGHADWLVEKELIKESGEEMTEYDRRLEIEVTQK